MVPGKAGRQKLCTLGLEEAHIRFPVGPKKQRSYMQSTLSVGHYTDFHVEPTCGLATEHRIIGEFDDPRSFLDTERVNAKILWFYKGFVEYKLPNFLHSSHTAKELEISFEISSEAPFTNENWPSDILFSFNRVEVGTWRYHDFGDQVGRYTPNWWPRSVNQYGLLKVIRINERGTFIDGVKISDVSIHQVQIHNPQWIFSIAVPDSAQYVGGITLFGSSFGNYNQDIDFRLYYN